MFRLVCTRDENQVANVDHGSDALTGDENRIFPIDRIGQRDESADQTHVPKGDRDLTFRLPFRSNPLDHPAAEKQPLAEESNGEPDMFIRDGHHETAMRAG